MIDRYQVLRRLLQDLQRRLERGEFDQNELRRRLHEAAIEDPKRPGGWWNLDPDTGGWIYSDGGEWYKVDNGSAPAPPVKVAAPTPQAESAGTRPHIGLALATLVVLTVIIAAAAWFVVRNRGIRLPMPMVQQTTDSSQTTSALQDGSPAPTDDDFEDVSAESGHSYTLTAGATVDAVTTPISAAGGSVEVGPGNPISGFAIQVPAGSYDETVTFTVSSAPITDADGPIPFEPVTPLFHVENGGGASHHPMRVRIPVASSAVADTLPFLYYPETGRLESLPLISRHNDAIETETRHFSYLVGLQIILALQQVFVSTDFTVGVDTWPFPNYGTHWEPEGICDGMTLSALWYRLHRRRPGGATLSHVLEPHRPFATPDFGLDDVRAHHFTTKIQGRNHEASGYALIGLPEERGKSLTGEAREEKEREYYTWAWQTVVGNMVVTGEPQPVAIEDEQGEFHALVAHSASIPDRRLYVHDPNSPRISSKSIRFNDQKIDTYYSSINAKVAMDEGEVPFVHFYPLYTEVVLDPVVLEAAWRASATERLKGPGYELVALDEEGVSAGPLGAKHHTGEKVLRVRLDERAGSAGMKLQVFRATESSNSPTSREVRPLALDRSAVEAAGIPLIDGQNDIGFLILAANSAKPKAGHAWRDFRWVSVQQGPLRLEPSPVHCQPRIPCRVDVVTTVPVEQPTFLWNVDDGSAESSGNQPWKELTFDDPGEHTIQVEMQNALQRKLGTAKAMAIVSGLSIRTSTTTIPINQKITFEAVPVNPPPGLYYMWSKGGPKKVRKGDTVRARFSRPGNGIIAVEAWEKGATSPWATAEVTLEVVGAFPKIDVALDPGIGGPLERYYAALQRAYETPVLDAKLAKKRLAPLYSAARAEWARYKTVSRRTREEELRLCEAKRQIVDFRAKITAIEGKTLEPHVPKERFLMRTLGDEEVRLIDLFLPLHSKFNALDKKRDEFLIISVWDDLEGGTKRVNLADRQWCENIMIGFSYMYFANANFEIESYNLLPLRICDRFVATAGERFYLKHVLQNLEEDPEMYTRPQSAETSASEVARFAKFFDRIRGKGPGMEDNVELLDAANDALEGLIPRYQAISREFEGVR
ncbi:MAG: hypothetical protein GY906_30335 [bacterium]|nr:hypothetical protein [bacterium]